MAFFYVIINSILAEKFSFFGEIEHSIKASSKLEAILFYLNFDFSPQEIRFSHKFLRFCLKRKT